MSSQQVPSLGFPRSNLSLLVCPIFITKCAVSRENLSSRFPTRSDTNRAVQPQKITRGLKFLIQEVEVCSKKKGTDQLRGTTQLICAFVFAYANRFSHDTAHILETSIVEISRNILRNQKIYMFRTMYSDRVFILFF